MASIPIKPVAWAGLIRFAVLLLPLAGCATGTLGTVAGAGSPPASQAEAVADAHGATIGLASFTTSSSVAAFPALFADAAKAHGIVLSDANAQAASADTLLAKGYISTDQDSDDARVTSVVDVYDASHRLVTHIEDQQEAKTGLDQATLAALANSTANDLAAFLVQRETVPTPAAAAVAMAGAPLNQIALASPQ